MTREGSLLLLRNRSVSSKAKEEKRELGTSKDPIDPKTRTCDATLESDGTGPDHHSSRLLLYLLLLPLLIHRASTLHSHDDGTHPPSVPFSPGFRNLSRRRNSWPRSRRRRRSREVGGSRAARVVGRRVEFQRRGAGLARVRAFVRGVGRRRRIVEVMVGRRSIRGG